MAKQLVEEREIYVQTLTNDAFHRKPGEMKHRGSYTEKAAFDVDEIMEEDIGGKDGK